MSRERELIDRAIADLEVDLSGLVVFTEAASGPYLWTPLLAARAGAEHVYALARDNHHHRAADAAAATREAAGDLRVEVVFDKAALGQADIVTNSASLRPITAADVAAMKPTAVLPLMWETWEFDGTALDLEACRARGILVLGTHECRPPCNLVPYMGFLALKLLFALGLEGHKTSVILLGRQALGAEVERFLRAVGCEVVTFTAPYDDLGAFVREHGGRFDALLVAEHVERDVLIGPGGRLEPADIAAVNPELRIGVITGTVDAAAARAAGLVVAPADVRGGGLMSYDASVLGPRPVLELFAAGLRVGAVMARARLAGLDVRAAAAAALRDGVAMDFPGEQAWA